MTPSDGAILAAQATRAPATEAELTVRGVVLGALMTFVFTAANVYLGLRVGLTFATSIPAAVISMALLRGFKDAGIRENNIVQTVASAAGTLASIIFVLPGLIMIGWWQNFPYWLSFGVCATGGILGVMFSIPLRRAMVVGSDLPYPEGVAAAEVLKVGVGSREGAAESHRGLRMISLGTIASAGFAALTAAKVFAEEVGGYFRFGNSATGVSTGFSLALLGAGHLVGLSVGIAMFVGLAFAWGIATPIISAMNPAPGEAAAAAVAAWRQVRFIGAGAIGVGALWKLAQLIGPIYQGIVTSLKASRANGKGSALPREEQDIPVRTMVIVSVVMLVPIAAVLIAFLDGGKLASISVPLVVGGLIYVVIIGAFVAAVCGYMAGLIGASNSPVSGVGILAVLGAALLLAKVAGPSLVGEAGTELAAYALFVTGIVFCVATISNDNLQDLKTGQLVGATPAKQQIALVIGALAGAAVIPPILDLLNQAYGFAGAIRPDGSTPTAPLPAPQATLISALAKGVLGGNLDWSLIGVGALVGIGFLVIDGLLGRFGLLRLPPMAIGIGIYLPQSATLPVTIGAILVHYYDKRANRARNPEAVKRMGVLMASGLIVGESLFGVLLAGIIVATGKSNPLALVGESFSPIDMILAVAAFIAVIAWLYKASFRAGEAP